MDELKSRLTRCFLAVLPDLSATEVEAATPASVSSWDSIATLNLLLVIQEEFGVAIEFADLMDGLSYQRIATYLQNEVQKEQSRT
jgi:acyl carrier protein